MFCRLQYDKSSNTYQNESNFDVQVLGFGDTNTVEYSVKHGKKMMKEYFKPFIKHFTRCGYEKGVSIRAAPYDWRMAAGNFTVLYVYKEY